MSKYLDHSERIASYLDGQMSPDQMQEFEKQLHTDPVLRSEFELQQDIIHTLRDFRKTQLKTRLDQVPVSMGPGGLMGIKAAAAIVISGIIGLGTYLYFTSQSEEPLSNIETIQPMDQLQEDVITEIPDPEVREEVTIDEELGQNQPETETPEADIAVNNTEETNQPAINKGDAPEEESPQVETEKPQPVITSPNLIDPDFDETGIEEPFEVPNATLAQKGITDNNIVEVETARKEGEMFHYQYYSGKLYLYGDFRDNPYEILELLNSSSGKRLFLYYNDAYYRILDNQEEITPLVELTDHGIIEKLEIIQANK